MSDPRRAAIEARLATGNREYDGDYEADLRYLLDENARLRTALQEIAGEELCDDDPKRLPCHGDSGPYCQHHAFDDQLVRKARAALTSPTETR